MRKVFIVLISVNLWLIIIRDNQRSPREIGKTIISQG